MNDWKEKSITELCAGPKGDENRERLLINHRVASSRNEAYAARLASRSKVLNEMRARSSRL